MDTHTESESSPAATDDATAAAAQAVTDEELFETYLAARLQQALGSLNAARDDLAAQPNDFSRALVVMRKVQELREAQVQLATQRDRVAAARAAAGLEAAPPEETATGIQATPGAEFRAAQAEQAGRIMAALAARPGTCASCQALLPVEAARCHCGWAVPAEPGDSRFDGTDRSVSPPPPAN